MSDIQQDFYPTPVTLIAKLLDGVDFDKVRAVLEPSAGKGDICDYIRKIANRDAKIDVVEIDPNLQLILKGKGFNLIHDDFLTFTTNKHYQLIVANFPFSAGAEHLQKALSLLEMYGGTLACLVNAETLRNPYTSLRKSLVAKLTSCGASIEYLQGEFTNAERVTSVEVALIRLTIEHEPRASTLLDNLKKADEHQATGRAYAGIVEADFITALIRRFDLECRAGISLIEEYDALRPLLLKNLTKTGEADRYNAPIIELQVGNASDYGGDYINEYVRAVRYKYWSVLIGDKRFTGLYTSNVTKDLAQQLDALKECDFSAFNIQQLQADLNRNLTSGIEAAILKLFDEFSGMYAYNEEYGDNIHYFNGWKSNKAHKINKKIILPINGFSSYRWDGDKLNTYYIFERVADMVKVFNYLAGELTDINTVVNSSIESANSAEAFRNLDFHYFQATFYKKGTCHIVFTDQKLLDKFNIFGSQQKGWLPPSYGKKTYTQMSDEERQVVDDFQGEDGYNEVVQNTDYYLVDTRQFLLEAAQEEAVA